MLYLTLLVGRIIDMTYTVLDFSESIIQLVVILGALLVSLFRFINTNNRCWLYSVLFFVGNLLSAYFWAAYIIIMGETPEVNDLLAYFGWNIAYLMLLFLLIHSKSREELKYFHPLMIVPIPLNILQFTLYIRYGGILNNIYQVGINTILVVLSLQSILFFMKKEKDDHTDLPYISISILLYVISEFGMWTSSSLYEWFEDIYVLYFPFSILNSITLLLIIWGIGQTLKNTVDNKIYVNKGIQNILKIIYSCIAAVCSLGGIFLGIWIRDVLNKGLSGNSSTSVFDIITVILFIMSAVISATAVAIVNIVYFVQKIAENERLKKERSIAEHSNAAKSEFLARMSHEIRTPMNAVLGMNEMILRESIKARDSLPDKKDEIRGIFADIAGYSNNISSAGNNLLAIINDILDISKIEAGKLEIREANYELGSILNSMDNIVTPRAKAKGLEFIIDVKEDLPNCLYGDEVRLRQIITNVVNNAVKYTREGCVTLYVSAGEPHVFEAGQTMDLIIRVLDTGIGIKEKDIDRLFDSFERMDMKQNSAIEGTGLGLAITKQLLNMMNGKISVSSVYGEGSEFTIHLPQKIASAEPIGDFRTKVEDITDKESDTDDSFTAPSARILIVDDTRLNLIVAMGLLKDTKIRTDLSGSGKGALNMMAKVSYDLVLLDQRMPEMDGIETLKHIRRREAGTGECVPVICLTADAIEGARQRYIDEGFTDYLTKPIDAHALKMMVKKYLPTEKIEPL
ncbi:MAG: response regulator [Lachnospiraceae bacterium]|nr:response regulator [Lachnospiraceae bacterium]